jgi:hypothetical protein
VGAVLLLAPLGCGGGDGGDGGEDAGAPEQQVFDLADAADQAGCEVKDTPSRGEADRLHTEGPGVKVAATAWNRDPEPGGTGRTLGCPRWNDGVIDALRAFRDEYRGKGPEPIP